MINDIKVIKYPGPTITLDVDDRTTSAESYTIKPGEPVKLSGAGCNFAIPLDNGEPRVGLDIFMGIAGKESTETSSADGKVEIISIIPGKTRLRGKVTTAANVDTAAELLGLKGDYVTFDVSAATGGEDFKIDEDEATDPNVHGLMILGGDIVNGTLDVSIHMLATFVAPLVGQTMD